MTLWLLLLYAAISGGILLEKNNITIWTDFEDIINTFSEEQDEQDPHSPRDKYKSQIQDPSYLSNIVKRVSHYHYEGGCDCKVENNIIDLGIHHFPRYLMNAVCDNNRDDFGGRCSHGSKCKPIEYNVSVLKVKSGKKRLDENQRSHQVPQILRSRFKFNVVTVIAGCICSQS
ncbi:Ptth family protein [Megaselia abdita]